jgi:hypothetical protein
MHDVSEGLLEMRRLLTVAEVAARAPGYDLIELSNALAGLLQVGAASLLIAARDAGMGDTRRRAIEAAARQMGVRE